jgi:diguanylate cyclase (GGDEF)-like protein/PAS domain S-box-containing protein
MSNQKLLIVDDSEDIQELVRVWLDREPLDFYSCTDGQESLMTAATLRPDLILLDVDLPGMNGFEVCRRLKSDPATSDIPIVFLTGAAATEEKLRGLEMGANDYVTKPFDPAELRARVRSSLHTKSLLDLLAQKEERFRILAENSSDVISRQALDGTFLYVSPASIAILGYMPEEMMGMKLSSFVHPDDKDPVEACYGGPRAVGETGQVEFRFRRSDGKYIWLEATCRRVTHSGSSAGEVHASARDVTSRKQMEHRELVRAEVLEMIAQGRPMDDILNRLVDAAHRQEPQAAAAAVGLIGDQNRHVAPRLPSTLATAIEAKLPEIIGRLTAQATQAEPAIVSDLRDDPAWKDLWALFREQGIRTCWAMLIQSRHREPSGAFFIYLRDNQRPGPSAVEMLRLASELSGVAREHRQLTEQLTFQAHHDALTRLPNRVLFNDRLSQALAAASRTRQPLAVLLIDVDRFKFVNDTYGHANGDELLCQVSNRLRNRLRSSDTLARMGGDEFAAILCNLSNANDTERVARDLVNEFKRPVDLCGRELAITITIGAAVFPRHGTDLASLLRSADLALYRAKEAGRNTSLVFSPEMGEGVVARLELESALRVAAERNELRLQYQPKVDHSGKIAGVEALICWDHPTLGLVSPVAFIPLAEETGLILSVGTWVLKESARQYRLWHEKGIAPPSMAVNVSAMQFAQPDFMKLIENTLADAACEKPWLEIELTESLLMKNMSDATDKLTKLHKLGVRVAIDDFGTGYSSLAYLQRLSLDTLKINHVFFDMIESGDQEGKTRSIAGAIVALAKSLGLQVVVEGIETEAQRDFITETGADLMQGFLFAPPLGGEEIEPILKRGSVPAGANAANFQLPRTTQPLAKSA